MPAANIGWLKLKGNAQKAATELAEQCPKIVFTSGRRQLSDQARAMASNVVKQQDWIKKTYKVNKASKACQEWVDSNTDKCKNKKEVEKGLFEVLDKLSDTDAQKISRHLGGLAFDIQPNTADIKTVRDVIKKYKGEFLDHEGKLCRWHAQFSG